MIWLFPPFKFNFEKVMSRCQSAMNFGVVNKSTTVNRFVLHTLQRNITHLAVITRKTNIKLGILKREGELEKSHDLNKCLNLTWESFVLPLGHLGSICEEGKGILSFSCVDLGLNKFQQQNECVQSIQV